MQRYFQISCHALVITAFFALVFTGRLDTPAIVVFTVGLGVSCYRTVKGLRPPLSPRGTFLLSCGYLLFLVLDMLAISRSFITAAIHLVLFLQLAKLYQEKEDRDYFYLFVLSFLQVLSASSLTIDISFVATLFLFMIALVSTLMSFDMYRSERSLKTKAEGVAMPLSGMSVWATIWIIVTGLILFLTIPRVGTGYFTRAPVQSLLVSGFNDTVQLGEIGQVKLSTAVIMRARQTSGTPFPVLKWRGIALDHFDGLNWSRSGRNRVVMPISREDRYTISPVVETRDAVRYDVLLEPLANNSLFAPYQVRAISGHIEGLEYDNDNSVYLRFPLARRLQYSVLSEIPNRPRAFKTAPREDAIPEEIRARYLQLPNDMDPRITQLADQITANGTSSLQKASLLETYLKRNYVYTLSPNWTPGSQPLSKFLFEAKTGHCEFFASSMAILLRASGIPTRLINGFLMGEYNPVGEDYIIRQSDAHSWVEAYIPGSGWIEFDPTPPDPNHRDIDLAVQMSHYIDAIELFWSSYVLVYDSGTQLQLFRSAQDQVLSVQTALREKSDRWTSQSVRVWDMISERLGRLLETAGFWAAVAVLVAGGVTYKYRRFIATQWRIWRIRQGRGTASEDVIEQLFYRAARLADHRASRRKPQQTWREWVLGISDARRRSILVEALAVFERSKYGGLPVSATDYAVLERTVRDLKL